MLNAQAHAILGADDAQDLVGTFVMDFVHPEFHKRIIKANERGSHGRNGSAGGTEVCPQRWKCHLRRNDNTTIYLSGKFMFSDNFSGM